METRIVYSIVKEPCERRSPIARHLQRTVRLTMKRRSAWDNSLAPSGGDERNRTADPLLAKQVLSHLSYIPSSRYPDHLPRQAAAVAAAPHPHTGPLVGLPGIEPGTSRLSSVRSDRLS